MDAERGTRNEKRQDAHDKKSYHADVDVRPSARTTTAGRARSRNHNSAGEWSAHRPPGELRLPIDRTIRRVVRLRVLRDEQRIEERFKQPFVQLFVQRIEQRAVQPRIPVEVEVRIEGEIDLKTQANTRRTIRPSLLPDVLLLVLRHEQHWAPSQSRREMPVCILPHGFAQKPARPNEGRAKGVTPCFSVGQNDLGGRGCAAVG
jgi:hypothetical protein